jgi:hypothetical protein
MSKEKEIIRITRTLNNIHHCCSKADDVHLDEVEVRNTWSKLPRKLEKQELVIRLTLFGAKHERP